jgi:hypothetical protein
MNEFTNNLINISILSSFQKLRPLFTHFIYRTKFKLLTNSIIFVGSSQIQFVVAEEGVNIRLECYAAGKPSPIIQWHRPDGLPIHTVNWYGKYYAI